MFVASLFGYVRFFFVFVFFYMSMLVCDVNYEIMFAITVPCDFGALTDLSQLQPFLCECENK